MTVVRSEEPLTQRWGDARDELGDLQSEAAEIAAALGRVAKGDVRLAISEVRDGIAAAVRTGIFAGIAVVLTLVALAWLPLPILLGLAEAMPLWAASLVTVAFLTLLALAFALLTLRQLKRTSFVPREALTRIKEDREWLRQQLFESKN